MSEYIKREDAKHLFLNHLGNRFPLSFKEQIVEKAFEELPPSADVVEARHGYWDKDMECSICGCLAPVSHVTGEEYAYDYCPNCGAKMDGEEQENE